MALSELFSGFVGAGCGVVAALGIEVWRCYLYEPRKKQMEVHAKYEAWLKVLIIDLSAMEEGAAMMKTMLRENGWASIGERFQTQILHEARIGIMEHEKSEKLFSKLTSVAVEAAELNVALESRASAIAANSGFKSGGDAIMERGRHQERGRAVLLALSMFLNTLQSAKREIEFQSQLSRGNSPKLPFTPE